MGSCCICIMFALFTVLMLGRSWLMCTGRGILSSLINSFSMVDVCLLGVLTCVTKILFLHAHSQISIHMTLPKTSYLHVLIFVLLIARLFAVVCESHVYSNLRSVLLSTQENNQICFPNLCLLGRYFSWH